MNELDTLVKNRRSIRKYKPDMPPPEWIEKMVGCAVCAPSPSNTQPVRFINIISTEKKQALLKSITQSRENFLNKIDAGEIQGEKVSSKKMKNLIRAYYRFSIFMFDAPMLFAVGTVSDVQGFSKKMLTAGLIHENVRGNTDLDISTGLALKGFILKAQELGLGTCIFTGSLTFVPNAAEILGIEDVRINCLVTVGFPDETPSPISRKPMSEIYREI